MLFRQQQTELGGIVTSTDKENLRAHLRKLTDELDRHLASEYGITEKNITNRKKFESEFAQWRKSHQPFHWFAEFYGILKVGGFDVIIGNPPYVETINIDYTVRGFKTTPCGDLFALCMERSGRLLTHGGRLGMIVPVSSVSTDGFSELRRCLRKQSFFAWILNFADRPSKLFTGVEKRLTIWLTKQGGDAAQLCLSNYKRWMAEERDVLFPKNEFVSDSSSSLLVGDSIPKSALQLNLAF